MAKILLAAALIAAVLWGGCDRYQPTPLGPYPTAPTDPVASWSRDYFYSDNRYKVSIFDGGDIEIALLGGPTFERLTFAAFTAWADTSLSDDPPILDPGEPDDPGDIEADPGGEPPGPSIDNPPPTTDVPDEPDLTYSGTRELALCHDHGLEYGLLNPHAAKRFERWKR